MSNIAEDFIQNFHSLEGTTIAQRKKNFFILLQQNASLKANSEALDHISTTLIPKTYLESLFRLEFFIYFRRNQELFRLLKEGDDVFVSKIAKQIWLFTSCFSEVGAEELVNEILPSLSFRVRTKVLRKLSQCLDDEQFDRIFEAVVTRYGMFVASHFITGCSPNKVRQIISEYPIDLTSAQLKFLFKKDPELIDYYFSHTTNSLHSNTYRNLIKSIFNTNRQLFNYLKEKYDFSLSLGRRTTKKIVDDAKDDIIKNPNNYSHLNMKAVIRKVGKDSTELFCNALPSQIDLSTISTILNDFPKKYHYKLFVTTLQNHYNIKFVERPDLIDQKLLDIIPNNLERALFAKIKVDEGKEDYLKYLTIQDSIPLIKERINLTSDIEERGRFIHYLLESCHINNNIDALLEVLKYFYIRHKNDDISVHVQFINDVESIFGFKNFNEEMWKNLNDLLTVHMLKHDKDLSTYQKIQTLPLIKFNKGTSEHQKLSYLEFLFNKNESIDDLLLEYLSPVNRGYKFPSHWGKYSKGFEKYFLLFTINKSSEIFKNDYKLKNFRCSLFGQIKKWNSCYCDDQLSCYDFPSLFETFNDVINDPGDRPDLEGCIIEAFKSKIFTTESNCYREEYLRIYWEHFGHFWSCRDLKWFLKYELLILVANFAKFLTEGIAAKETKKLKCIWYTIKKLSHLQLDERAIEFCTSKLNSEDKSDKSSPVTCLSIIMTPEKYMTIADCYKPTSKTLDLDNQKEVKLYKLQCSIANNFINTGNQKVIPSLLNYCGGDYLKHCLRSLYALLYRTPEKILPQYLSALVQKAVSVRKHALYLSCALSTISEVKQIFKLLNQREENVSIRNCLFRATVSYFVKNPTDEIFCLVKSNMIFIKATDKGALNVIANASKIPEKYRAVYIHYSWDYLEKTVEEWKQVGPLKEKLLRSIDAEIAKQLPLEFGLRLIQKHFLKDDKVLNIAQFTFEFLVSQNEKNVILESLLNLLDECDIQQALQFFNDWYSQIMSRDGDLKYFQSFIDFFEKRIRIIEDFGDYIKLFFLKIKLDFTELSLDDVSGKIVAFLQDLITNYGPYVLNLFAGVMRSTMRHFASESTTVYDYYYYLIEKYPTPNVALLVLELLSSSFDEESIRILKILKDTSDVGVQLSLHCKFNLETNPLIYQEHVQA